MERDARAFLWDIEHYGNLALRWGSTIAEAAYDSDDKTRFAIERALQNTGEALARLARHDSALAARLPEHRQIIGFRNVLVHGYDSLATGRILAIIKQDLPRLMKAAAEIRAELDAHDPP